MNTARPVRDAVAFVAVAYAVSWTFFGLYTTFTDLDPLVRTLLFLGGGFGPFVAALGLVALRGEGVREWLGRVFRVRVPGRLYAFALVLPVVGVTLAGALHVALGGRVTPEALPPLVEYPLVLLFVLFLGGGMEEPGWRGYLLPRLQSRYGALVAALLVGVVWAVWHAPLFLSPETVQYGIPFALYTVQVVAMSVVLTWLTNAARWSVLPAVVLHAGANTVVSYYPVGGVAGGTSVTGYGLLTTVVVVVAVALVLGSRGRLAAGAPGAPEAGPGPTATH